MRIASQAFVLVVGVAWAIAGCGHQEALDGPLDPGDPVPDGYEEYTIVQTDYRDPPKKMAVVDDRLDLAKVPRFEAELVHSNQVEGWDLNLSQAVFHLDVPVLKPDQDQAFLQLRPTYKDAIQAARYWKVIPSVNLIDGKAKQFDDGLYAALDLAYYSAHEETLVGHVELVKRLAEAVGPDSPAAPFLSAGLSLAGVEVPASDTQQRDKWLQDFEANKLRSKPLGFYNWSPQLQECWRFLKFMQQPFMLSKDEWPPETKAMADALAADEKLRADYQRATDFYARLTNPLVALTLLDVKEETNPADVAAQQVAQQMHPAVAVFPSSTSREQRLFDRLFPLGFPEGVNLMEALIVAVQKGNVDLTPSDNSGWYDYQCYALETFLLPQRGEEATKLLLSARYKQRMVDAFAALITKRRETHIRQLAAAAETAAADEEYLMPEPLQRLAPALRLEPNATYYLRTARAYAFLQAFLNEALGNDYLAQLKGLREGGTRETDLASELSQQMNLVYGFYLLSVEDIGLPAVLKEGELADPDAARSLARDWLAKFADDPDLAVDTRVVVPIAINPLEKRTQLWGTAGVRLAKLNVDYDENLRPSVRPAGSTDAWQKFDGELVQTQYAIPVDEFVSVEIDRLDCPTREEFRRLCNQAKTTADLQQALQNPGR